MDKDIKNVLNFLKKHDFATATLDKGASDRVV